QEVNKQFASSITRFSMANFQSSFSTSGAWASSFWRASALANLEGCHHARFTPHASRIMLHASRIMSEEGLDRRWTRMDADVLRRLARPDEVKSELLVGRAPVADSAPYLRPSASICG